MPAAQGTSPGLAEGAEPAFTPVADQAVKEQVRAPKAPIEVIVKAAPETAAWEFPTAASMAAKHAEIVAVVAEQAAAVEVAVLAEQAEGAPVVVAPTEADVPAFLFPTAASMAALKAPEPEPVAFPVSAPVEAAPVVAAPEPVAAPAPAPAADLDQLLGSAGLTLAATDPEKLRAAREAAEQVAPPVRVPRTRKPLPPQADEPLIQVDTRQ